MRMFRRYFTVFATLAALCFGAAAQAPEVRVTMKPDSILIGDHVSLRIEVRKDMMQVVDFPVFDREQQGVKVIKDLPPDTVETDGRRQTIIKEYVLTSFHAGNYNMRGLKVLYLDKNITDTIALGDLDLQVVTFDVDTVNTTIYDIKPPLGAPVMVDEFKGYVLGAIFAGAVLAALTWVIANALSRRRKKGEEDGKPKSKIPPHVRAIAGLERLHNQKLWQNGRHKQYYTLLTDIVREYLEGRYGIGAMEMTSDEIIGAVSPLPLADKDFDALKEMLRTADLVKFAKFVPAADYNEKAYYDAYSFVEDTKEVAEEIKQAEVTQIQTKEVSGDEM